MPETTITLSQQEVAALPIGVIQPESNPTLTRLFTIEEAEPAPCVIPPPGWYVDGPARRDGKLIYAINRLTEQAHTTMPSDHSLARQYTQFHDRGEASSRLITPRIDSKSSAEFTKWLAAQMADDITDKPILPEFRRNALPALRVAWLDATNAVADAIRMRPPQNPPPDTDFLLQTAAPATAQVASIWPLTDRARQYVRRHNQNCPDRIISGHYPSLRQTLEYEGFRVADAQ